ncbi:hemicentin-2-like isoform X2 [Alosa pseudoharengus]|uniref:hemicentin-2-like isoform X2 n=1 Tax=Alosa pseudoharengus TaxID=34774 RepID=UPI003F88AB1F
MLTNSLFHFVNHSCPPLFSGGLTFASPSLSHHTSTSQSLSNTTAHSMELCLLLVLSLCSYSGLAAESCAWVLSTYPDSTIRPRMDPADFPIQELSQVDYTLSRLNAELVKSTDLERRQAIVTLMQRTISSRPGLLKVPGMATLANQLSGLALPTATVTVESPEGPYYPGDEVPLRCVIAEHTDWDQYNWYRDEVSIQNEESQQHNSQSITISLPDQAGLYQYTCEGSSRNSPKTSQRSTPASITVKAFPEPTLTVKPNPVFTGESVTLTCGIQPSTGWSYVWDNLPSSKASETNSNTLTISGAAVSDQGEYKCSGVRKGRRKTSPYSNTVQLTVKSLPTARVTVESPEGPYYPGDEVTLRCDIAEYTGWYWYIWRRGNDYIQPQNGQSITTALPDKAGQYQYTCEGRSRNRPKTSQRSTPASVSVRAFPEPTLTVKPNPVFTGESVTLTCGIQPSTGWSYVWDNLPSSKASETNSNTLTISGAAVSDQGEYKCSGVRKGRRKTSPYSNTVQLTVKSLPTARVTVESPEGPYYPGDEVTLRCDIAEYTGWYWYIWRRGNDYIQPQNGQSITTALPDKAGQYQYTCEGRSRNRPKTSQRSTPASVSVRAFPEPTLTVKPNPVFTGESVTLTCGIQPSTGWSYVWDNLPSSKASETNSNTLTISGAAVSDQGEYKCSGVRKGRRKTSPYSNTVQLTVKSLPTARVTVESPEGPYYPGDEVTLRCDIAEHTDWYWYYWYRDGYSIQNGQSQAVTISLPDQAGLYQYTCAGSRGTRPMTSQRGTPVSLTLKTFPVPKLTAKPNPVFTGESVALTCGIQPSIGWSYVWNKPLSSRVSSTTSNTFTISGATVSDQGEYKCSGVRKRSRKTSYYSSTVQLTVEALPTARVTVESPEGPYYPGDEVTLRCDIAEYTGWYWYIWRRGNDYIQPQNGQSITTALPDKAGQYQYTCEGRSRNRPKTSQRSTPASVSVRAFPLPTLTVQPNPVFTGESVTLTCGIQPSLGWSYAWDKLLSSRVSETNSNTLTISRATVSDQGGYTCSGVREGSRKTSPYSNTVQLTVEQLPLATLTVEPQSPVFTGENVTLKCVIESLSGWTYKWYKESSRTPVSEGNTFTIRGAAESHKGQYWCQGERRHRPTSSQESRRITLDVKDSKPKLTSPGHQLLIGDSVTLKCELGVSSGLVFHWYRDTQISDPVAQTDGNSYSISSVKDSDGGPYWCRAGRGDPVFYTQYSDAAEIKFIASVIIHSNWTQIFTSEPLSLSCPNSTEWRLRWFTGRGGESKCPTDWRSETGSTCSISSAPPSDSGVYWCQSESGEQSNPVNITVHTGDTILESPVHPVTEGDPLTLHCRYRYQPSNISADFYKDGTLLQTSTTGEMTIPAVSKSHEGLYKCSNPERGESPESRVTVRDKGLDSDSSTLVVAVSVVIGLLVAFALVILLVLLYRSQKAKGSGPVTPNLVQSNRHSLISPQRQVAGGAVVGTGDVVSAEIELKDKNAEKKKKKGPFVKYANNSDTLYSLLNPVKKPGEDGAGPSDVTYAQVNVKPKTPKKPKKQDSAGPSDVTYADVQIKMKPLERRANPMYSEDEHVYSSVKPECSSDGGSNDATYAQVRKKAKKPGNTYA